KFPEEGSNTQLSHLWVKKPGEPNEQTYAIVERSDEFSGQNVIKHKKNTNDEEFPLIGKSPIPPGGMEEFYKYIRKNLKYPEEAKAQKLEGKVYVSFTVEKDGAITEVFTKERIGGGFDEEAVRVVQNAPKWTPGKQGGQNAMSKITMPIEFRLDEPAKTD